LKILLQICYKHLRISQQEKIIDLRQKVAEAVY